MAHPVFCFGAELMAEALVWDAHAGLYPSPQSDLSGIGAWHAAGVDHVSLNIGFDVLGRADAVATLAAYRRVLATMEGVRIAATMKDVTRARQLGKLAVSFDIEGAGALNNDAGMVSVYHDLGVRQMLLAYNLNSTASGGCHDRDGGLSAFGREVIAEMARVGMVLDLSHMGRRSSLEAIALANGPVVFSHSNAASLWNHGRNIHAEQIRACAATGGVIGVNGIGIFLGDNDTRPETFANHVCAIADLVGPAHVGLGLDHTPAQKNPPDVAAILRANPDFWPPGQGYDTPDIAAMAPGALARVVDILHARGWHEGDLRAFLGENFARVAARVWPD